MIRKIKLIYKTPFFRSVLHVFKRPLEEPDQKGGQLLNQTELKIIFGNLPPIYDVHMKMLAVSGLLVIINVFITFRFSQSQTKFTSRY